MFLVCISFKCKKLRFGETLQKNVYKGLYVYKNLRNTALKNSKKSYLIFGTLNFVYCKGMNVVNEVCYNKISL